MQTPMGDASVAHVIRQIDVDNFRINDSIHIKTRKKEIKMASVSLRVIYYLVYSSSNKYGLFRYTFNQCRNGYSIQHVDVNDNDSDDKWMHI